MRRLQFVLAFAHSAIALITAGTAMAQERCKADPDEALAAAMDYHRKIGLEGAAAKQGQYRDISSS